MRFAAIALATGLLGTLAAIGVQNDALSTVTGATDLPLLALDDLDIEAVGSIVSADDRSSRDSMRLIDLRSGETCITAAAPPASSTFTDAPLGRDCKTTPVLSRIAYWRSREDGTLILADRGGGTVMEFAPGDGVLYESVYPSDALMTIVPARG